MIWGNNLWSVIPVATIQDGQAFNLGKKSSLRIGTKFGDREIGEIWCQEAKGGICGERGRGKGEMKKGRAITALPRIFSGKVIVG